MRKSIKSLIVMFILILGICQMSTLTFAKTNIPSATNDFYVNDFAEIFSADEKSRLMDNAIALSNEHDGVQVVVTTVKSLEGDTVENYALEMYNQYGIGKNDMGLLILLSTEDRKIRVEVGKSMEAYINDSKAGRFIDKYAISSLKKDKFNEGLINLQEALINEVAANIENEAMSNDASKSEHDFDFWSIIGVFLIVCVFLGIIGFLVLFIRKINNKREERRRIVYSLSEQLEQSKQEIINIKSRAHEEANQLQEKIHNLIEDKNKLSSNYQNLENNYKILEDRYRRVQNLYPTADEEVTAMIEQEVQQKNMKIAKEVDEIIQKVINASASKDIVSEIHEAKNHYLSLNKEQKSYIKSDINKLNQLYNESLKLKQEYDRKEKEERNKKMAAEAVASIVAIISCISIGKARDLRRLKEAKSIYDNLNSESQVYFDQSVADKLNKLLREAKRDKEEAEEAERRRKREEEDRIRRMNSSSSSFGESSGGFGGFGGISGGGGASRGF